MLQVEVMSELRIAGQNSEYSDMDNPRGYIHAEVFFLVVTNDQGKRWAGPIVNGRESRLVGALQRSINKGHNPTLSLAFQPMQPVYGSEAYQTGGHELENLMCEMKDEFLTPAQMVAVLMGQ